MVGIYGNLMTRRNVLAMIRLAKEHGAMVVVGGPEPYSYARSIWTAAPTWWSRGEGELTLEELVPHLLASGQAAADLENSPASPFAAPTASIVGTPARARSTTSTPSRCPTARRSTSDATRRPGAATTARARSR